MHQGDTLIVKVGDVEVGRMTIPFTEHFTDPIRTEYIIVLDAAVLAKAILPHLKP